MTRELCAEGDDSINTKSAMYKRLGIESEKADRVWGMAANALVTIEQIERRKAEEWAARNLLQPLLYIDSCRYDETPLPATSAHNIIITRAPKIGC